MALSNAVSRTIIPNWIDRMLGKLLPAKEYEVLKKLQPNIIQEVHISNTEYDTASNLARVTKDFADAAAKSAAEADAAADLAYIAKDRLANSSYNGKVTVNTSSEFNLAVDDASSKVKSTFNLAVDAYSKATTAATMSEPNPEASIYDNRKVLINTLMIEEVARESAKAAAELATASVWAAKAASPVSAEKAFRLAATASAKADIISKYAAITSEYATNLEDLALRYKNASEILASALKLYVGELDTYLKRPAGKNIPIKSSKDALLAAFVEAQKANHSILDIQDKYRTNINNINQPLEEAKKSLEDTSIVKKDIDQTVKIIREEIKSGKMSGDTSRLVDELEAKASNALKAAQEYLDKARIYSRDSARPNAIAIEQAEMAKQKRDNAYKLAEEAQRALGEKREAQLALRQNSQQQIKGGRSRRKRKTKRRKNKRTNRKK